MKTASELLKISNLKGEEKINKILKNVEKHIIKKCEEEALEGNKSCRINLNSINSKLQDKLLNEFIKNFNKFEKIGYYIFIEKSSIITKNSINNYNINLSINIYWDKEFFNFMIKSNYYDDSIILYTTNIESNNKCFKCNEEKDIISKSVTIFSNANRYYYK